MNKNNTLTHQRGAIAIEMIFVVIPLLLVILLGVDITRYVQAKDQLDRLGYSLGTIISQRSQYYLDRQGKPLSLNQQQVDQLTTIARNELNQLDVKLRVHQISLNAGRNYRGNKAVFKDNSLGDISCQRLEREQLKQQLKTTAEKNNPAIQLFVVELCLELSDFSLFAKFSDSDDFSSLYSRNITVAR